MILNIIVQLLGTGILFLCSFFFIISIFQVLEKEESGSVSQADNAVLHSCIVRFQKFLQDNRDKFSQPVKEVTVLSIIGGT